VRWQGIVVHHSASQDGTEIDLETYRRYHVESRGWSDIAYHVILERIGDYYEALLGRPLYRPGAHCLGKNDTHLGVCFAGNFMAAAPSPPQLLAGAKAIAGLCSACGIDPAEIYPHKAFRDTACPGDAFPLAELRAMVEGLIGAPA
jgi:hypothetical protein